MRRFLSLILSLIPAAVSVCAYAQNSTSKPPLVVRPVALNCMTNLGWGID